MRGNVVKIGPDHPLWRSWDDDDWNGATADNWDDDDWNGATADNWVRSYAPGADIRLAPPRWCSSNLVRRIHDALSRVAQSVKIVPRLDDE